MTIFKLVAAKAMESRKRLHRHHLIGVIGLVAILVLVDVILGGGAHASTQGPSAGTTIQAITAGWTTSTNAEVCDTTNLATESIASAATGTVLATGTYGFTIPAGSTINGVQVDIYRLVAATSSHNSVEDSTVSLVIAGAASGSNLATATAWTATRTDETFGGPSTLWGLTPTVAQVNAAGFGVEIIPKNVHISGASTALTAEVDCMDITITYTAPSISFTQSNYRFYQNQNLPSLPNGGTWTQQAATAGWPARMRAASFTFNGDMWVIGGAESGGAASDIYSSPDGVNWTSQGSAAFGARSLMATVVYDNEIWVFGGQSAVGNPIGDVWVSGNGTTWTEQTASPAWAARYGAQAVVYNGKMWIFGGHGASGALNDAWYSTDGITWSQATACSSSCFTARYQFGATVFNNEMWVIGGWNGTTYYHDVYESTDGTTWTQVTAAAAWNAENDIAVAVYNGYMWALGGNDGTTAYNTAYCSSNGSTWSDSTSGSPACGSSAPWTSGKRYGASALVFNNELWVMGGYTGSGYLSDTNFTTMPGIDLGSTSAMAAQDANITALGDGTAFRLRMDLGVSTANLNANGQSFILEYAPLPSGACSAVSTGNYLPITTTTPISYYNQNATAANGESLLDTNSIDPTESGTINKEEYLQSPTTTFSDPTGINSGNYGVYDFALTTNQIVEGTSYCVAMFTDTSGTIAPLTTYSQIPEISAPTTNVSGSSYRFYQNVDSTYAASAWTLKTSSPFSQGLEMMGTGVLGSNMYVLGGQSSGVATAADDYTSNGTTWTDTTATWSARQQEGVAVLSNTMYVMGGRPTTVGENNDVYSTTNGTTWSTVLNDCSSACTNQWSERSAFVTLVFNNKIWVIGGYDGTNYLDDVWSSSNGSTWTEVTTQAAFPGRSDFTGMVYGGKMWIMGGFASSTYYNDVWSSSDGVNWTEATSGAPWAVREDQTSAVYDNQMYMIGGESNIGAFTDVWHSTDGVNWVEQSSNAIPGGASVADSFGGSLWQMGGFNAGTWYNTAYAYNAGAIDVSTPLDSSTQPLDMTKYDSIFKNMLSPAPSPIRLRWDINMAGSGKNQTNTDVLGVGDLDIRLQYAAMVGGSCTATESSGTWSDVTTSTPIQWYTTFTNVANGNPLVPDTNDPTDGSNNIIYEDFVDQNYFGDTISPIYAGQDGLWDFSLAVEANPPHSSYCLHLIYDNGSNADYGSSSMVYNIDPQINIAPTMIQLLRGREWWNSSAVREYKDIK